MKLVTAVFLLLLGVSMGTGPEERIVGGQDAPEGLAPYQVSIRFMRYQHNCGASIIQESWILTASHCIYSYIPYFSYLSVVVGTNQRTQGGDHYDLDSYILHEDYDTKTQANDIALLKTKTPMNFNDKVKAVPLPSRDTETGTSLLLTGWGELQTDGEIPDNLQMIYLPAISTEDCAAKYDEFYRPRGKVFPITDKQLCVDGGPGKGGCKGDSGGPLVDGDMLAGVVSVGVVPCGIGMPDVTTRVFKYVSWIREKMSS